MAEVAKSLGCQHYDRKCALIAPCCKKQYTCRLCHDEQEPTHTLDRKAVSRVVCLACKTEQDVSQSCGQCHTEFGKYYCEVCRLFDDKERQQFHCAQCGLCRVGGRENFFHCDKCDLCLNIELKDNHRCVEKASHDTCPVCLEDMHTSREPMHIPPCGHILHSACFRQCLKNGLYACPNCNESMVDMKSAWKEVDEERDQVQMPEEYKNMLVDIVCRDCHKKSQANFHVVGLKCGHCGSYNTAR